MTNTGKQAGYETVLVFVKDEVSSVVTPLQQLKAFQKIFLNPGETRQVELEIPFDEFGLWNEEMKYVVEPGNRITDRTLGRGYPGETRDTLQISYYKTKSKNKGQVTGIRQ